MTYQPLIYITGHRGMVGAAIIKICKRKALQNLQHELMQNLSLLIKKLSGSYFPSIPFYISR
jgi:hypothetical protein